MAKDIYLRQGVYYSDFYATVKNKKERIRKKLCRDKELAEKMAAELKASMKKGMEEPSSTVYGMLKVAMEGGTPLEESGTLNLQIKWDPKELLALVAGKKNFFIEVKGIAKA